MKIAATPNVWDRVRVVSAAGNEGGVGAPCRAAVEVRSLISDTDAPIRDSLDSVLVNRVGYCRCFALPK
jgi:hypothetical protein